MKEEEQFKVIEEYLCIKMPREIDHHNSDYISQNADYYICHQNVNHIVFDFSDTEFMDSSGIGIILGRYKKVQCFGGRLFAIHAGRRIRKILMMSGMQSLMEIKQEKEW
ncbi:MAG: anti-sigma factor antagonist [Lachnospiraceae bacterium]|nr:anti-sigma factor antagonist [Lachnospiraceae bacterium]